MVPKVGIEPTRGCPHWILKVAVSAFDPKRTFTFQEKVLIKNPTPFTTENPLPLPLPGLNLKEHID
jgi:hypothetical protein